MNDTDNNKSGKTGFDAELARLERRVDELLIAVDTLKEENRALRQRLYEASVARGSRGGATVAACGASS